MQRSLLFVSAAIVLLSLTVTGLTAPRVTLRVAWWGNPTRDARTLKVIEMYMAENPKVIIQPETTAWAGYWDKLATQAAANVLPDIMQHDYVYLRQYVGKDLIADLTPFVESRQIDLAGVDKVFTSGGMVQSKFYGISLGTNAMGVAYDPAILRRAGLAAPSIDWTWADLEKMAHEIYRQTGVRTLPFGTTDPRPIFENWVRQAGKSFYNTRDGASLGFTETKLLTEYFAMQCRLLKAGVLIKPETAFVTKTADEAEFSKGLSWLEFLWSNQLVMQANANKRPIALTLLPKIAQPRRPGTYLKPSMFFAVAKSTTNKKEAIGFINYFINDLEANKVLLAERGIPIVPAVRDALKDMVDPVNKKVIDFITLVGKNASPIDPPDPPGSGEVLKLLRDTLQEVLYQTISPQDGAAKFIKRANAILAANKVK